MTDRRMKNGLPTSQQELLLRAALLRGQEAVRAWEKWESIVDVENLDFGSIRLVPLLYQNLHAQGINHHMMMKFKGVYRNTWYKNRLLFHHMAALLRSFHEAGIKTLILKGAALTLLYYREYGLRPMEDFDVLVPTEKAPAAINLLEELNWRSQVIAPDRLTQEYRSFIHAHPFKDDSGWQLDLHWRVLYTSVEKNADDGFWHGAISTRIGDVLTLALNPADQLLHICVHGSWWNPVPPLRWVADAMAILKKEPKMDWNRVIGQAEKHRLVLPMRETLSYLREHLKAPVPQEVLQSLMRFPVSRGERIEYKAQTCPDDMRGPILTFWLFCSQYLRSVGDMGPLQRLGGFPRFLQIVWGKDRLWQVVCFAAYKGLRRVWKKAHWYKNELMSVFFHP